MRSQKGLSLIELLIALAIFSIVILGAGISCLQSLRFTREAMYHSYALIHAQTIANCIQFCADQHELAALKQQVIDRLPEGELKLNIDKEQVDVELKWAPSFTILEKEPDDIQIHVQKRGLYLK